MMGESYYGAHIKDHDADIFLPSTQQRSVYSIDYVGLSFLDEDEMEIVRRHAENLLGKLNQNLGHNLLKVIVKRPSEIDTDCKTMVVVHLCKKNYTTSIVKQEHTATIDEVVGGQAYGKILASDLILKALIDVEALAMKKRRKVIRNPFSTVRKMRLSVN